MTTVSELRKQLDQFPDDMEILSGSENQEILNIELNLSVRRCAVHPNFNDWYCFDGKNPWHSTNIIECLIMDWN